jgi:glycosyltransferase involved in cell wall biosynthesis
LPAFFNLFSSKSYNIARFNNSELRAYLASLYDKQDFDIVIIDSVYMKDYIPLIRQHSKAKIILRSPNIEHKIWERMAETATSFFKKRYLKILAKRLKREEIQACHDVDGIFTVSAVDKGYFTKIGIQKQIEVIPTGIDMTKVSTEETIVPKKIDFFHIGAMDWMPNIEAVDFLLKEIWPNIIAEFPELQLYLAGRNCPKELLEHKQKGVEVLGEVEDAAAFFNAHAVMLVPLLSGSGQRVKIIEAMSMGKVIITTTIGLEGIDAVNGEHLLIADTPEAFLDAARQLITDKSLYAKLSNNAKSFANEHYDNVKIANKLEKFLLYFLP